MAEIEAFESNDLSGTEVLSGGTATASNNYNAGQSAPKAIDGSLSSIWSSGGGLSDYQWWQCDCGSSFAIASMRFYANDPASAALHPREAVLEASNDGSNWTTFATIEPPNSKAQWLDLIEHWI